MHKTLKRDGQQGDTVLLWGGQTEQYFHTTSCRQSQKLPLTSMPRSSIYSFVYSAVLREMYASTIHLRNGVSDSKSVRYLLKAAGEELNDLPVLALLPGVGHMEDHYCTKQERSADSYTSQYVYQRQPQTLRFMLINSHCANQ